MQGRGPAADGLAPTAGKRVPARERFVKFREMSRRGAPDTSRPASFDLAGIVPGAGATALGAGPERVRRLGHGHLARIAAEPAGAPTRATSASVTWLTAVPRSWRTASSTPFMPCRYASDR